MPAVPALGRPEQEGQELEASLGCIASETLSQELMGQTHDKNRRNYNKTPHEITFTISGSLKHASVLLNALFLLSLSSLKGRGRAATRILQLP